MFILDDNVDFKIILSTKDIRSHGIADSPQLSPSFDCEQYMTVEITLKVTRNHLINKSNSFLQKLFQLCMFIFIMQLRLYISIQLKLLIYIICFKNCIIFNDTLRIAWRPRR